MMSRSQILKKIGNIIEELSEQQQYLATTNKINLLELELFTANADFLIDHIEILKKLNDRHDDVAADSAKFLKNEPEKLPKPQPDVAGKDSKNSEKETLETSKQEEQKSRFSFSFDEEPTEMIFDFEKKLAVEEVFDRPLNDEERRLLEEKSSAAIEKPEEFIVLDVNENQKSAAEMPEANETEPFLMVRNEEQNVGAGKMEDPSETVPSENSFAENKILKDQTIASKTEAPKATTDTQLDSALTVGDLASTEKRPLTLNEMLSAKLNQNTTQNNQRQAKKLEDLKSAISINDKMVFIKELFNGYNLAYSEAIEIVNRFDNFEAADNFLQKNYALKNDWEGKQVTVKRFYEYLHKKFVM
ncbi:MAG TPA: hypothetical protein VF273_04150 [Pelobium sp.]